MFLTYALSVVLMVCLLIPFIFAIVKISQSNISATAKAFWALITLAFPFFGAILCFVVLTSQETDEKRKHA